MSRVHHADAGPLETVEPRVPSAAEFGHGLARAAAGALLFALPMHMTMEMWWLGFYMHPLRLALLLLLAGPLLFRLSRYGGFRHTASWRDDAADALVSIVVAAVVSATVLALLGQLGPGMAVREWVGRVSVQLVPAALGAMLARNQLASGGAKRDRESAEATYAGELFLMVVGSLFLALNVAPTDEIMLIAYILPPWAQLLLLLVSVAVLHGFVFSLRWGQAVSHRPKLTALQNFAAFTVVGYALVLGVSAYTLWTFGRLDGLAPATMLSACIVLGFPGAVGAAAARLLL